MTLDDAMILLQLARQSRFLVLLFCIAVSWVDPAVLSAQDIDHCDPVNDAPRCAPYPDFAVIASPSASMLSFGAHFFTPGDPPFLLTLPDGTILSSKGGSPWITVDTDPIFGDTLNIFQQGSLSC